MTKTEHQARQKFLNAASQERREKIINAYMQSIEGAVAHFRPYEAPNLIWNAYRWLDAVIEEAINSYIITDTADTEELYGIADYWLEMAGRAAGISEKSMNKIQRGKKT